MIAHHTSKGRELGSADAAMGAASFVNLARISLAIEPISEKEAPNIGVSPWDSKSYFRITGTKQNLSPANNSDRLFRMISVEMDNAEPPVYLKGDSVGVAELFIPSSKLAPYSDQMLNSVLIQIKNANEPLSVSSNSSNHVGPTVLAAINPYRGGKANDNDVNAILSYLIKINYLSVVDVEVKRSGRGAYKRKAYELTALGLSRILQEKP